MNLQKLPIFAMLTSKMGWLNERQRVLSQNIANADTPGYTPKDLKPVNFAREVAATERKLKVAATAPSHIAPRISGGMWRADAERKGQDRDDGEHRRAATHARPCSLCAVSTNRSSANR